jgi:hypothetical protein
VAFNTFLNDPPALFSKTLLCQEGEKVVEKTCGEASSAHLLFSRITRQSLATERLGLDSD